MLRTVNAYSSDFAGTSRAPPWVLATVPVDSSWVRSRRTVDTDTKEETVSFKERTDVTAVPAAGVVAETMVSLVLANEVLRKFGGDSLPELLRNHPANVVGLEDRHGAESTPRARGARRASA